MPKYLPALFVSVGIYLATWPAPLRAQTGDCFTLAAGCLDTSFGANSNGEIATRLGNDAYAKAVALESVPQPDGTFATKIVAATQAYTNGNPVFAVARYNLDGTVDGTFNGTGIVVSNKPGYVQSIAIQTDGKILVAGFTSNAVRFNLDGSVDTSFGSNGAISIPVTRTSNPAVYAIAIQSDGKIVLAGSTTGMAAWRFNPNGTPDTTFASGGSTVLSFGKGSSSRALALTLQNVPVSGGSEQRIVLGGWATSATKSTKTGGYDNFAVARLTSAGQLDNSFGSGGEVVTTIAPLNDVIRSVVIDSQNRIVAGGYANFTGSYVFALARYNTNGSPDLSFGSSGATSLRILPGSNYGFALALQPDGNILLAGSAYNSANKSYQAVVRFTSLGALDGTFGSGGFVTTDFASFGAVGADGNAMALQPDGKIVVAGEVQLVIMPSSSEAGLARYLP